MSTVIGLIFFQLENNQKSVQGINGLMFMSMMMTAMTQLGATINTFGADMPLYMREHHAGMYSMTALFFSRNISDLPLEILKPCIFGTIVFNLTGLMNNVPEYYGSFLLILIVHAMTGASAGYLIGALAPSRETAQLFLPLVILPQMIFAGFMVNLDSLPVFLSWVQHISFFKYTYHLLMVNVWRGWGDIPCELQRCAYLNGKQVLDYLSIDEDKYSQAFYILLTIMLAARGLAWFGLVRRAAKYTGVDN